MLSPDRLDLVPFKRFAAFATLDDETAAKFNYLLAAITADPKMREASATIAALNGFMRAHPVQKDTHLDPTDHFLDEVELYKGFTKALNDTERRKYNSLLSKARSAMRKDEKTKAYGLLVQLAQLLRIEPSSDGAESFGRPVGVRLFIKKPDPELNPDTKAILKALDAIHTRIGALEREKRSGGEPTAPTDNINYWEAKRLLRHANMAMRYDQKKIEFADQVKDAQATARVRPSYWPRDISADEMPGLKPTQADADLQKLIDAVLDAEGTSIMGATNELLETLDKLKIPTPTAFLGTSTGSGYDRILVTKDDEGDLRIQLTQHYDESVADEFFKHADAAMKLQDEAIAREQASFGKLSEGIDQAIKDADQHCATVDKTIVAIDKALLKAEEKRNVSRGFWRTMATPFTWVASKFRKEQNQHDEG